GSMRSCAKTGNPRRTQMTWAIEFLHDQLAMGRKLGVSRFRYCAILERATASEIPEDDRGRPGPFVSPDLDLWVDQRGVTLTSLERKVHGQCLTESFKGYVSGGMSERHLVDELRRCAPKMRDLT